MMSHCPSFQRQVTFHIGQFVFICFGRQVLNISLYMHGYMYLQSKDIRLFVRWSVIFRNSCLSVHVCLSQSLTVHVVFF